MEFNVINIPLTQCYLEMARSILFANVRHNEEEQVNESPINIDLSFKISFASLTTIYSYMAVESFMNYSLYELWNHSRLSHDKIEELNRDYPEYKCVALYDDFYTWQDA